MLIYRGHITIIKIDDSINVLLSKILNLRIFDPIEDNQIGNK